CLAGMGRTGTILAAYLIWEGQSALDALETARSIEPRWVQSQAQVSFLTAFELALQKIHDNNEQGTAIIQAQSPSGT
ncbi:MAG: hypothetical protein PHS51_06125, partial [Gallionella sp.]|nr:hypothetical protein [Gallionella sp.]